MWLFGHLNLHGGCLYGLWLDFVEYVVAFIVAYVLLIVFELVDFF